MKLFASLFSLPALITFFVVWFVASIAKPLAVVSILCVLTKPSAAWRKFQIFICTLQYLLLCNDKTWKAPKEDVESYFDGKKEIQR